MTYKVKLSKKNQGAIPVAVLRDLDLEPNQENHLIIYKNLNGDYFIGTQHQMLKKLAGSLGQKLSLKVKEKVSNMSFDEVVTAEKQAAIKKSVNRFKPSI
jgi:hypothetical protein